MEINYGTLKAQAIALRKQGLSYGEIKEEISVSKGTLSLWLKGIHLTTEQRERLYTKQAVILARGPNSQKERRKREVQTIIQQAEQEITKPISIEAFRLFGAALYWAEGDKTQKFGFANSDPHFILFMVKWLEKIFEIKPTRLKAALNIYPQQNELELKQFWSHVTGIPLKNFNKSFVKPANKGYKKNNLYYGTMKVYVLRGTDFRYKLFGWVKAVLYDIAPEITLAQKEWKSLRDTPRPVNIQETKNTKV